MLVLGVDPGSIVTGFGLIRVSAGRTELVDFGIIELKGEELHGQRLKQIYEGVCRLIERHRPDECALEMPVYGKNPQSMLKLGRAQAAAMLAALNHDVPIAQYTPKEVKKSVTGNGNAAKDQVWYMVRTILEIGESHPALKLDASDALAVGICHSHRCGKPGTPRYTGWDAFVRSNPGRVGR